MSIDDAKAAVLRGAWSLIEGDAVAAARHLADAATEAESLSASERRLLRDDRLWSQMPEDADDRWFRSATVVGLAHRIGQTGRDVNGAPDAEQAALL